MFPDLFAQLLCRAVDQCAQAKGLREVYFRHCNGHIASRSTLVKLENGNIGEIASIGSTLNSIPFNLTLYDSALAEEIYGTRTPFLRQAFIEMVLTASEEEDSRLVSFDSKGIIRVASPRTDYLFTGIDAIIALGQYSELSGQIEVISREIKQAEIRGILPER